MAKKDFTNIDTTKKETGVNTGAVFTTIETGKHAYRQQGTASPEEQAERAASMKTQGRKGCKAARVNLALSTGNYEYVKIMSRMTGQSMTEFINRCLQAQREEHPELYEQAKAVIAALEHKGGAADE